MLTWGEGGGGGILTLIMFDDMGGRPWLRNICTASKESFKKTDIYDPL